MILRGDAFGTLETKLSSWDLESLHGAAVATVLSGRRSCASVADGFGVVRIDERLQLDDPLLLILHDSLHVNCAFVYVVRRIECAESALLQHLHSFGLHIQCTHQLRHLDVTGAREGIRLRSRG